MPKDQGDSARHGARRRLLQLDAGLARVELRLAALLLGAMLLCVAASAVARSTGRPLLWSDELSLYLTAEPAFLAASAALFGLHGLTWGTAGMRQVVIRGEVATVEDLNGARIRTVPLAPEMDSWTGVGAVPTPMPLPALYDAFANGQVDAMQIDHEGTWNSGYWRHAGTILNSRHMMFPMAAVASGRKWQAMSEDDRATVARIFDERVAEMVDLYGEIDAANLERLRESDVPVVTVGRDWFGPAVDAMSEEWREKAPLLSALEAEAAQ